MASRSGTACFVSSWDTVIWVGCVCSVGKAFRLPTSSQKFVRPEQPRLTSPITNPNAYNILKMAMAFLQLTCLTPITESRLLKEPSVTWATWRDESTDCTPETETLVLYGAARGIALNDDRAENLHFKLTEELAEADLCDRSVSDIFQTALAKYNSMTSNSTTGHLIDRLVCPLYLRGPDTQVRKGKLILVEVDCDDDAKILDEDDKSELDQYY